MMTEKILQSWSSLRWRSDNNIHFSYVYNTNIKFSAGASHQSRRSRRRPPPRRGAADPSPSSVIPRSGRGGKTAWQKVG